MKRLICQFVRLYPRQWRARYGREFNAMLQQMDLKCSDLFDVIWGALGMRFVNGGNFTMDEETARPRILELRSRDIPHGFDLDETLAASSISATPT
jgi:hypothetical protein